MAGLGDTIAEFFTKEAGQNRRRWLDEKSAGAEDFLRYYLGPTGLVDKAAGAARALEYTDAGDVLEGAEASQALWDDPSLQNFARYATAGAAMAIPMVSAKMIGDGIDVGGDAVRSLADDMSMFYRSEAGNTPDLPLFRGMSLEDELDAKQRLFDLAQIHPEVRDFARLVQSGQFDKVTPQHYAAVERLGALDTIMAANPNTDLNFTTKPLQYGMEDVYHYTRSPGRLNYFDVGRHGTAQPHDRLGVHVGTEAAAEDRMRSFADNYSGMGGKTHYGNMLELKANMGKPFMYEDALKYATDRAGGAWADNVPGFTTDHNLPTIERWYNQASAGYGTDAWTESELNRFLEMVAESEYAPGDGKYILPAGYADKAREFGKYLSEQGYTNVPYFNQIEDPGSISNIMLTENRQFGDAPVLRYPDARFDERFYHLPNLTAGVAPFALGLPALMAGDRPTEGKE